MKEPGSRKSVNYHKEHNLVTDSQSRDSGGEAEVALYEQQGAAQAPIPGQAKARGQRTWGQRSG